MLNFSISNLDGSNKPPQIVLTLGNQHIDFETKGYDRGDFNQFPVFDEINRFWKTTNEHFHASVFAKYAEIKTTIINFIGDQSKLIEIIQPLVRDLIQLHTVDRFNTFLFTQCGVVIPHDIREHYAVDANTPTTIDQTYTKSDYAGLVRMSFVLRLLIPIWGEYMFIAAVENVFKELNACRLMHDSWLYDTPEIEKLKSYISANIGKDTDLTPIIIHGINSDEFPEWLMSFIMVTKLCVCDFTCSRPNIKQTDLIKMVFKAIRSKVQSLENQFQVSIRAKSPGSDTDSVSDGIGSQAERYMVNENHAAGEIAIQEVGAAQHANIIRKLAPNLPVEIYNACMRSETQMLTKTVSENHKTLLAWLIGDVLSYTVVLGGGYLEKVTLVRLLCLFSAIVWHKGHKDLAVFLTSVQFRSIDSVTGPETLDKLSLENIERLNVLFPLRRNTKTQSKTSKEPNAVITAIDTLSKSMLTTYYQITASPELLSNDQRASNGSFNPTRGLRNLIASLIIDFNEELQ